MQTGPWTQKHVMRDFKAELPWMLKTGKRCENLCAKVFQPGITPPGFGRTVKAGFSSQFGIFKSGIVQQSQDILFLYCPAFSMKSAFYTFVQVFGQLTRGNLVPDLRAFLNNQDIFHIRAIFPGLGFSIFIDRSVGISAVQGLAPGLRIRKF